MNARWKTMSDEELKALLREAAAELARRRPTLPAEEHVRAQHAFNRALDAGAEAAEAAFGALSEDEAMDVAEALKQAVRAESEAGLAPNSIVVERRGSAWVARLDARGIRVEAPSAAQAARSLRSSLRAA